MAFRVLTMAVDLCRLTTRTMNVNAGHERTSKARIIHQIQLIRGITVFFSRGLPIEFGNVWLKGNKYYLGTVLQRREVS
ncbi:hypothetical protein SDY_3640 [Shigella dysenteriae Sd197]|uniref:Uncharacterized protein n=2 Tax=Shigella dysenteriae TaxID=622 RepID=Q32AP7_SHIDS|nr:hypothetical protein SDY_3640 [Shigella dysenteriae Sd197]